MNENFYFPEKILEKKEVNLNDNLFNQLDEVLKSLPENKSKDRNIFEFILNESKKKCFEYLGETLGFILNPPRKIEEKGEKKEEKKKKIHAVNSALSSIEQSLGLLEIPLNLGTENRKEACRDFRKIALDYALNHVLDYEKEVMENKRNSDEVMKEMNLKGVVNNEYLEKNLVRKINELPVEIKENLLLVEKQK